MRMMDKNFLEFDDNFFVNINHISTMELRIDNKNSSHRITLTVSDYTHHHRYGSEQEATYDFKEMVRVIRNSNE